MENFELVALSELKLSDFLIGVVKMSTKSPAPIRSGACGRCCKREFTAFVAPFTRLLRFIIGFFMANDMLSDCYIT